jgi:hypothetical protein
MHRNHPQWSVVSGQRSVDLRGDYRDCTPNTEPRTILHWIILLSTQHTPLNTRNPTTGALIPCETALPVRHVAEQRPEVTAGAQSQADFLTTDR